MNLTISHKGVQHEVVCEVVPMHRLQPSGMLWPDELEIHSIDGKTDLVDSEALEEVRQLCWEHINRMGAQATEG